MMAKHHSFHWGNPPIPFKSTLGIMAVLLISVTTLLPGCKKSEPESKRVVESMVTATVSVSKVERNIADNQIEVVGTVQAVERAEIASKITGNIVRLPVDLGSRVKQGELLVEISAGEISAQVQQAKAQLEQARRNLAREESLLTKKATTLQTVKSLRDISNIAAAAYREAQTMLAYTKISAPFSGIITKTIGNIGDLATPGKPLLYIEEDNNLEIQTDIPEAMLLAVQKDDRLSVFVPSLKLTLEGVVAEVSPIADPSSRSAPIKLRIASDPRLRSGQFARVTLARDQTETLTIPSSALLPFGQMERVFVADGDKARLRLVRTGTKSDGRIEILSGLSGDETVIIAGNNNLLDGQPITVQ